MKWFETYVEHVQSSRASISARSREHVNTQEKREQFADKLCFVQEHDVQLQLTPVMVPMV